MNLLITAGNTQTPIDQVRCITNVFTGRTGARIAVEAYQRGHRVTLLTSHPEVLGELADNQEFSALRWKVRKYQTYDELQDLMAEEIISGDDHAIIHAAAVSDYSMAGVFVTDAGTAFDPQSYVFTSLNIPRLSDASSGKVKSHHNELWLRLVPTAKLVDKIRKDWQFPGILVKFKLEVGITESELLQIAERSRLQSQADVMVANTLETLQESAYMGVRGADYRKLPRTELAKELLQAIESLVP